MNEWRTLLAAVVICGVAIVASPAHFAAVSNPAGSSSRLQFLESTRTFLGLPNGSVLASQVNESANADEQTKKRIKTIEESLTLMGDR